MKKYRFIIIDLHGQIINIQENLTENEVTERARCFIDNGYYQMANYRIEII